MPFVKPAPDRSAVLYRRGWTLDGAAVESFLDGSVILDGRPLVGPSDDLAVATALPNFCHAFASHEMPAVAARAPELVRGRDWQGAFSRAFGRAIGPVQAREGSMPAPRFGGTATTDRRTSYTTRGADS